jgi:hypothetical protein
LTSRVCLFLLAVLSLGAAVAAAQGGFTLQQSFGMGSSMGSMFNQTINDDFWNLYTPGLSDGFDFPWFDWKFNESYDLGDMYSHYSEYYVSSTPIVTGIVSAPVKFEITKRTPARVYLSSGQQITYNQYAASAMRGNELWIQGSAGLSQYEWSQYVVCPAGTNLQLVAFVPAGGQADFFETIQTNSVNATSKRYNFYSGYNDMQFTADQIGRHILLFVVNNQPSNAIIVDVISPAPPVVQPQQVVGQTPYTGSMPPANQYGGQYQSGQQYATGGQITGSQAYTSGYSQTTQGSGLSQSSSLQYAQYTSAQTSTPIPVPQPTSGLSTGDTPVTIQTSLKGYDVWVDGVHIGKEGTGGDVLDGIYRFRVIGGQTHTIRIFDGVNNYEKPMYFERGVSKVINVPPAATVIVSGGLI